MEELDIAVLKKKALKGVIALTGRTFFIQCIGFAATFLLTVFLNPSVFGIFFVVSAVISFLSYFSDIGLAAALIQKKEELTNDDLSTTFTIQELLVLLLSVGIFLAAPLIASFYRLDGSGMWLLRALVVSFFLSSLKTIPSVLLERKLDFNTLVIPQIVETLGFYGIAVFLAWRGFGVMSFTYAVLVRGVAGLITMYTLSPWRIQIGISRPVAGRLLRFGIPFQLNSVLALVKDDLLTLFLGRVLPFSQVGYIGWAKKWAEVPLRLIMDSVIRVTFPAFARLQEKKELLGSAIEKAFFGLSATIFPISVALFFFIEPIVSLIPKYSKWEPALISFYFFVFSSLIAAFSTPLTNVINAIGKIRITLSLMVFWTVATWVGTIFFIQWFGFNGVAGVSLLLSLSIVIIIAIVKRFAPFSVITSVGVPFLAAVVQSLFYAICRYLFPVNPINIGASLCIGGILFMGIVWIMERKRILGFVNIVKSA